MMQNYLLPLGLIFLCLLTYSCEDDDLATDVGVVTEDIITTSGERVILTGRILSTVEIALTDHGFEIAEDENFGAPILISLGARTLPGRFVGELAGLTIRTQYYSRAYIKEGEATTYGEVVPFSTLSPSALTYAPRFGTQGTSITIEGNNLSDDTQVLWGDQTFAPDELSFESIVKFRAPAIGSINFPQVGLITQGDTLLLDEPFEYIVGEWTAEKMYTEDAGKERQFYFRLGDDFVYGLGPATGVWALLDKVKVVDLMTFDTTSLTFPGVPAEGTFFAEGYIGGGSTFRVKQNDPTVAATTAFWKYENLGFEQLADLPVALYKAACIKVDNSLYVYGGEFTDRLPNMDVYRYDIPSDTWSLFGSAPVSPLNSLPAYRLNDINYFIRADSTIFSHDIATDQWQIEGIYENEIQEYGLSLVVDGQIYLGMNKDSRKLFFYDEANDRWTPKRTPQETNPHFTISGFEYNGDIWVLRGIQPLGLDRTVWRLDPDAF